MFLSTLVSYLPYALVTAFTPGPNNVVALYAISNNGWRKGKNVLLGIASGFLIVMTICAVFCYELAKYVPDVAAILKYVGAAYIAYLAVHIALSRPDSGESSRSSFLKGFLLEFVNVKIILYAITVYTAYVIPHDARLGTLICNGVCLAAIGVTANVTWAAAGGLLQRFLKKYYRPFNILMGVILLWCAVSLVFDL